MSEVAVFGIGPSGMAAGWAAIRAGHTVHFYSESANMSPVLGYKYMDALLPLPPEVAKSIPHARVARSLKGNVSSYHAKVYGARWGEFSTAAELTGMADVWDARATYSALWKLVTPHSRARLATAKISHNWIAAHTKLLSQYAHVISTIPATALCDNPSLFPAREACFFSNYKSKISVTHIIGSAEPSEVNHDGTEEASWFRTAVMFGFRTVEWPSWEKRIPARSQVSTILNPMKTDCHCHPEIIRLGHWGAWRRGILPSHVFMDTVKTLEGSWVNESWQ